MSSPIVAQDDKFESAPILTFMTMVGGQGPVGGMRKGASTSQGNKQPGNQDIVDTAIDHIQKRTLQGIQNLLETSQWRASESREKFQKSGCAAQVVAGLVPEELRVLAKEVDRLWSSAASMGKSPYRHVHGVTPHESILLSAIHLGLRDGSVLHGSCRVADGSWLYSEIDLNTHYGNKEGKFISGGAGFKSTGRHFALEHGESSLVLKGELYANGGCMEAEIDLSACIVVKDGKLVFEQYDSAWRRDGWIANGAERTPILGYAIAVLQNAYGNQDQAQRAVAHCTNSNILTGAALGGGQVGVFLATPLAILARNGLAKGINDPRIRAQFEATTEQAFCASLKNAVSGEYVLSSTAGLPPAFVEELVQSWSKGEEKALNDWLCMTIRGSVQAKSKL